MGRSEVGIASTTKLPYSANNVRLPATDDGSLAGIMWYGFNGNYIFNSSNTEIVSGTSYTTNDVIGIALDLDNLNVKFYKNNTLDETFNIPNSNYTFVAGDGATGYGGGWTANFGQKSFTYTPPTGFVALQQDNLPETAKGISGLVWTKNRDSTDNHQLYDSSRGKQKAIFPNTTDVQATVTDGLQKFLAGGQQIEDNDAINTAGESFVTWNWVANSGTTSSNTDGSITSTVQANTTAGFSVVQYTGTGSAATVGHGLSSTPEWIFGRPVEQTGGYNWSVYHKSMTSASYYLSLNLSNAETSNSNVWGSAPTSSVINIGTSMSASTEPMILYCWHSVDGFSKFGKYSANNSADGPFVYLGFKPKFLIIKASGAISWYIMDATRNTFNPVINGVTIDNPQAEFTVQFKVDFLSNGFKIRNDSSVYGGSTNNTSYSPYFYMAFAEHPFVGDGTSPVTAR